MARQPDNKSADKSAANLQSDDSALIRELALLLDETSLTEIEIERSGLRVRVARNVTVSAEMPRRFPPQAPRRPPPADGRPRLLVARARRQAVHRGRQQGIGRTDAADHRGNEDDEP